MSGVVFTSLMKYSPCIGAVAIFLAMMSTPANRAPSALAALAAISTNSGKSFSEPVEIASTGSSGHVGVSLIDKHSYVVSWMESDKDGTYAVNLRARTVDGQLGRVRTIGRTSVARNVPQMILVGDKLIFAWTDEMSDLNKVVSVEVPILGFYD